MVAIQCPCSGIFQVSLGAFLAKKGDDLSSLGIAPLFDCSGVHSYKVLFRLVVKDRFEPTFWYIL